MSVNADIAKLERFVGRTPSGIFDGELAGKLVEKLRLDEPDKEHPLQTSPMGSGGDEGYRSMPNHAYDSASETPA